MNFNVGVDINHFKEYSLNLCGTSCAKHKTYCKCIVFPSSSLSRNLQHLSRRQEGLEQIYEICSKAGLNGFMESSQFHQSLLNFQGSLSLVIKIEIMTKLMYRLYNVLCIDEEDNHITSPKLGRWSFRLTLVSTKF